MKLPDAAAEMTGSERDGNVRENEMTTSISDLNTFELDELVERLGYLFEHSPWIVRETLANRPFSSRRSFHDALCATVRNADPDAQLALIQEHPDLVGRAALDGTLTRSSTAEQNAAGLDAGALTDAEREMFRRFNAGYWARFAFPFVICARENKKASILRGFETRLCNDRETEIATALSEIEKIAWYRLANMMTDEDGGES